MKYFDSESTLSFSWNQVVTAFWQRYPNPYSHHVLTEDVIARKMYDGKLYTKRLLTKRGKSPKLLKRFTGNDDRVILVEESVLDMESKLLTTYTRNIQQESVLSVHEKCEYKSDIENKSSVACYKQAWFNSNISGFRGVITSIACNQYQANTEKTVLGFNFVLQSLFDPNFMMQVRKNEENKSNNRINYLLNILRKIHRKFREILFTHCRLILGQQPKAIQN